MSHALATATANRAAFRCRPARARRGVLLLVVLSMLTLFLMLGAAYVVATSRARETARAYARLTLGSDSARIPAPRLLDSVMLTVLRGPSITGTLAPSGGTPVVGGTVSFESLLADKYGLATATGSAAGIAAPAVTTTATDSSILSVTINNLSSGSLFPTDLNGRVLSFVAPGRAVTSHRIIRAANASDSNTNSQTGNLRLYLDTPATQRPFTLPLAGRVIVNGREFTGPASINPPANEPWDAFDAHNPFLAQVATGTTISTSTVSRFSYLPALPTATLTATWDYDADGIPDAADNDNDGVFDGVFLNFGIPDATDGNGNAVKLRASVLVVDLDGRFNVNAHDSLARILYTGTNYNFSSNANNCWPAFPASAPLGSGTVPMGSGYGPAEVNGAWMTFTSSSLTGTGVSSFAASENPLLLSLAGGTSSLLNGRRPGGSRYSSGTSTPRIGSLEGRYGEKGATNWNTVSGSLFLASGTFAVPGTANVDDEPGRTNDRRADPQQPSSVNYGVPQVWWTGTNGFDWSSNATVPTPRGVFNSPPDLHGRMRTITGSAAGVGSIVPQLLFIKPEWYANSARETTDDPYEILLDTRRGGGGQLHDPATDGTTPGALADNPFLPSELEAVLRPYDIDSNRLAPRLAAMLGSAAEEARLRVTTESWDTTAITGSAAIVLFGTAGGSGGWLQQCTSGTLYGSDMITGIIGGEVSRGEKLDLNRGLRTSGTDTAGYNATGLYYGQRQALFKDIFTLLVALDKASTPKGTLAQWAANVVEFRDADSTMTPFEYDTNPTNGWDVDGDVNTPDGSDRAVVFGAERPEMFIAETFGWERSDVIASATTTTGGMCITLHRPWNAVASGTGTMQTPGEPCDYALDTLSNGTGGQPVNSIDLGKKSGTSSSYDELTGSVYPIWRLRITSDAGTQYVRFDTNTASSNELLVSGSGTPGTGIESGTAKPKLAVDTSYTFFSGPTVNIGTSTTVTLTLSGSCRRALDSNNFRVQGKPLTLTTGTRTGTVFLERLSNPSGSATAAIWNAPPIDSNTISTTNPLQYVVVDSATISIINTGSQVSPPPTLSSMRRDTSSATTSPWRNSFTSTALPTPSYSYPNPPSTPRTFWMPWPNRPFVSSAELLLVPRLHQLGLLQNYTMPTVTNQDTVGIPVAPDLLFDAVHVPTRFAGIHRTGTGNGPPMAGIYTTANQISSFHEPGRVNLNTISGSDVWNAVVAGQLPVPVQPFSTWSTLIMSGKPAQSMAHLLALSGTGSGYGVIVQSDTVAILQTSGSLNPLHSIYTATRLANTTTPRSNVFAVWITLRESTANDPDSVKYRRAFYIIDRSIPVGYEEGRDHNVRDCIRLRRIIE